MESKNLGWEKRGGRKRGGEGKTAKVIEEGEEGKTARAKEEGEDE